MLKKFIELPGTTQLIILLAVLSLCFNIFQGFQLAWHKYANIRGLKQEIETLQDSLTQTMQEQVKLTQDGKKTTKAVQVKSKDIDKKLKDDQIFIDSSDVSIDDINRYISKYKQ